MVELEIKQGDDWELELLYEDSKQNPIDIEFGSLLLQIRRTPTSVLIEQLSTETGEIKINLNQILINLENERTRKLPSGVFLFDLQLTLNDKVATLMSGTVNIIPDIAYDNEQIDNQTD